MLRCGTCQYSFFFPNFIALSPPTEILEYIAKYVTETDPCHQKPLYQAGRPSRSNANSAVSWALFPGPTENRRVNGLGCQTAHFIASGPFRLSRRPLDYCPLDTTPPDDALTARIYDAANLSLDQFPSNSFGMIPLTKEDPDFEENDFWRLPVDLGVVLAAFMDRAIVVPDNWSTYHVRLAKSIYTRLYVQKHSWNGDTIPSQPEKKDGRKWKR